MAKKDPILRKDFDYQHTVLEGFLFLFSEAREDGCLHEYEDLIDTIWAFIPSKHKMKKLVYDQDMKKEGPAYLAWNEALKIGPSVGAEELQKNPKLRIGVRNRCLRKVQIVCDVAEQLKLLGGKETAFEEMGEESDVFREVTEGGGPF